MKKLIPLLFLCLFFIISCSSQNSGSSSHPFPPLAIGEDTLNTSVNSISQTTGANYITWEDSCLSMSDSSGKLTSLRPLAQWIDTLALDSLHTVAYNLRQPGSKFITALEVYFGIDANHHFTLFFKPIALSRQTYIPGQTVATYTVTTSSQASNSYYTFDTNSHHLIPVLPGTLASALHNFQTYINISQSVTHPAPGGFNPQSDSTGSTTSVILSFQEIFDFILQNDSAAKSSGKTFSTVNVFNTCIQYTVVSKGIQVIKEDIMLGINNCTSYDDLGHLCPPDCENTLLTYPVYITQ